MSADQPNRGNAIVHRLLQPEGWPEPRGYANGALAAGRMVFTGGLVGWDAEGRFAADFLGQTRQLLRNIVAVLAAGGARPEHMVRMTWYVCDIEEYRVALKPLGAVWREEMGRAYPPMAVVQVVRLVEPAARLEIETTAVLPG
jgi:enamine deaminase RidA (YjgF/YER057c/UK114 family)